MKVSELMKAFTEGLETQLSAASVHTWFAGMGTVSYENDCLTVSIDHFRREVIMAKYLQRSEEILSAITGRPTTLEIIDTGDSPYPAEEFSSRPSPEEEPPVILPQIIDVPSPPDPPVDERLYSEYTFDKFVVGSSNRFAHAAASAVADKPGRAYNPLFIYGSSGLGKTHLLHAIADSVARNYPGYSIVFVRGEEFTSNLIRAIRDDTRVEFQNKYRRADLLLVDDIQFIAGKPATEEEFFHTFTALHEARKQIVLTSDRPPKDIYTLQDRLRTRFENGLLADIQPPDYETRMAILRNKADSIGIDIPEEYMRYIANSITANIRQLEGTIKNLYFNQSLTHTGIDFKLVQQVINRVLVENPGLKPTPSLIIDHVSRYYSVKPDLLRSENRSKEAVTPRQAAMYIMREMTDMSLPDIGRELGKEHSTVIYSLKKVDKDIREGGQLSRQIKDIMSNIKEI